MSKIIHDRRGFSGVEFEDSYGHIGYAKCSSAIDHTERGMQNPGSSFLWLGVLNPRHYRFDEHGERVSVDLPEGVRCESVLHLTRQQVEDLVQHLQQWLTTYRFE